MSANLIINHDWAALLVDGDEDHVRRGLEFFSRHPNTQNISPTYLNRWIDRESVNEVFSEEGFTGQIDLFVLDIDGVDYWIWDALTVASPRVVVVEVQPHLADVSVTVPYDPAFQVQWIQLSGSASSRGEDSSALPKRQGAIGNFTMYGGASLPAFNKLARSKGYRLIGANRLGNNAFFMRNDVGVEYFPEVTCESCVYPHVPEGVNELQREILEKCEWVEV